MRRALICWITIVSSSFAAPPGLLVDVPAAMSTYPFFEELGVDPAAVTRIFRGHATQIFREYEQLVDACRLERNADPVAYFETFKRLTDDVAEPNRQILEALHVSHQ